MATRVRFSLFGGLTLRIDEQDLAVPQRRERNVLAVLVAAHGSPVPADRLVDQLWGGEAPPRALTSLQVAISRLRTLLEPERERRSPAEVLVSAAGGYALRVSTDQVDVWAFEREAERVLTAAATEAITLSDSALARWSGAPYADCDDTELVRAEADRLADLRVAVEEARGQALLDLRRPDQAVRELGALAEQHPFRERLWSLLALGQYRGLRQAEALATLRTLRTRLDDELGVDPSPEIRELETAMLNQADWLAPPSPPSPAPAAARSMPASGLIGRDAAWAELTGTVAALRGGRGGAVIISGDAGIGKSRLVGELGRYASAAGIRVVVGRGHEADVAPAYWPWLPVIRGLAEGRQPAEIETLLGSASPAVTDDGSGAALRTYDAVASLVRKAGVAQPLMIVLEDMHWADVSSLQLLAYAVEALVDAPVLLIITRRTAGQVAGAGLPAALAALARVGATRIRLAGLSTADVAALLTAELDADATALAPVVASRTEGNPFFVIEFARLLAARGVTNPAQVQAIAVPEGIADVLRLRLERLPAGTRELLEVASVAGRTLSPAVIAEVTGTPVGEVVDGLDVALASGLLEPAPSGYAFTHALTRETLYADLPPGRRSRLHGAVGDALVARLEGDPELRTEIAHHYRLAAPLSSAYAAKATEQLQRAAESADARHAFAESSELWRQSAEAATLTAEPDLLLRHRLLTGLARAELRIGHVDDAQGRVAEAVAIARGQQRWDLVAEAAVVLAGAGAWSWREFGSSDPEMIKALEECIEHLPPGPLVAQVLVSLQMEHYFGYDVAAGEAYGRRAVEMARASGDQAVLLQVLLIRCLATWAPGGQTERVALCEEMLALPLHGESEVSVLYQYATALHQAARPTDADAVMERCVAAARRLKHTGADIPIAWWRAMRAREREDPDAQALGDAALALHVRSAMLAQDELSGLHTVLYAPPGAPIPPDLVAIAAISPNFGFRARIAYAVLESGDVAEAVRVAGPAGAADARDYAALASDCLRTAIWAATGEADRIRAALNRIQRWSGQVVTYGSVDHLGAVDYFIATGLEALGDLGGAYAHAEAAVALTNTIGNRPWGRRAHALLDRLARLTANR